MSPTCVRESLSSASRPYLPLYPPQQNSSEAPTSSEYEDLDQFQAIDPRSPTKLPHQESHRGRPNMPTSPEYRELGDFQNSQPTSQQTSPYQTSPRARLFVPTPLDYKERGQLQASQPTSPADLSYKNSHRIPQGPRSPEYEYLDKFQSMHQTASANLPEQRPPRTPQRRPSTTSQQRPPRTPQQRPLRTTQLIPTPPINKQLYAALSREYETLRQQASPTTVMPYFPAPRQLHTGDYTEESPVTSQVQDVDSSQSEKTGDPLVDTGHTSLTHRQARGATNKFFSLFKSKESRNFARDPPKPDPYVGSDDIVSLKKNTFKYFIKNLEAAFVLFYNPFDDNCRWAKLSMAEAAGSTIKDNHAYAAVDCTKECELCNKHGIKSFPTMKLYSRGMVVNTYSDNNVLLSSEIRKFVETVPVIDMELKTPKCSIKESLGCLFPIPVHKKTAPHQKLRTYKHEV